MMRSKKASWLMENIGMIILVLIVVAILAFVFRDKVRDLVSVGSCDSAHCNAVGDCPKGYSPGFNTCEEGGKKGKCCVEDIG